MARVSVKGIAKRALDEDVKARKAVHSAATLKVPELNPSGSHLSGVQDSYANLALKLGLGADNSTSSSRYTFNPLTRDRLQLEWIHRGSWLGGMAVDIPADDMTRKGIEYKTELDPSDQEQMDQLAQALNVWGQIADTIRWARLYGGAIAVHMIDGQDPREPLRVNTVGPKQYKGTLVLDRWMLDPSMDDLVREPGPHLGLPRYYRVQANAPALRGMAIHYTRVAFRLVGVKLPYQQALTENLWGISVIERLHDRMIGFDQATAGTTQLVSKAFLRMLKIKGLREVAATGGDALAALQGQMEVMRRYQGIEGISLIDSEDEFQTHQHGAFSGLSDVLVQLGQQFSGATEIPLVRLFGQSPAGLNSTGESDFRNYYDGINKRQRSELFNGVLLTYVLIAQSLGIKLPPNFWLDFRSMWDLTEEEKATTAKTTTDTVVAAHGEGLISDQVALKELRQSSRITGLFTNISRADIDNAATQTNPPPDAHELLARVNALGAGGPPPQGEEDGSEVRPQADQGNVDAGAARRGLVQQPVAAGGTPGQKPAGRPFVRQRPVAGSPA